MSLLGIGPKTGPDTEEIAADETVLPPPIDEEVQEEGKKGPSLQEVVAKLAVPEGMFGKLVAGIHNSAAALTHDDVFRLTADLQQTWDTFLALALGPIIKDVRYIALIIMGAYLAQAETAMVLAHMQNVKLAQEAAKARQPTQPQPRPSPEDHA